MEESVGASAPVLSIRGLTKSFGAVKALSGVDLDVDAGEVVALVGDNGAGKSTIIKILSGVYQPDAGTIEINGQRTALNNPEAAHEAGIATVFQDLALCDNLSIIENLFLGREIGSWRLDSIAMETKSWSLLRQLSAKIPTVHAHVSALSGGQRQTVAIARSLLGEPSLILLDEPTAALGVEQTAEVLNLVDRLRNSGLGVIFISHNMQNVQAVADRIAVLRLGRNNGFFSSGDGATADDLVAAITGASDNVATRRAAADAARMAPRPAAEGE